MQRFGTDGLRRPRWRKEFGDHTRRGPPTPDARWGAPARCPGPALPDCPHPLTGEHLCVVRRRAVRPPGGWVHRLLSPDLNGSLAMGGRDRRRGHSRAAGAAGVRAVGAGSSSSTRQGRAVPAGPGRRSCGVAGARSFQLIIPVGRRLLRPGCVAGGSSRCRSSPQGQSSPGNNVKRRCSLRGRLLQGGPTRLKVGGGDRERPRTLHRPDRPDHAAEGGRPAHPLDEILSDNRHDQRGLSAKSLEVHHGRVGGWRLTLVELKDIQAARQHASAPLARQAEA